MRIRSMGTGKSRFSMGMFVLIIFAVYMVFAQRRISDEISKEMISSMEGMEASTGRVFSNYEILSELIASSRELFYNKAPTLPNSKGSALAAVLKDDNIESIYCMTPEGNVVGLTRTGRVEKSSNDIEWMKKAIEQNAGQTQARKSIFSDKIVVTFLKPVVSIENIKLEGIVGVEVDLGKVWDKLLVENTKTGNEYFIAVGYDKTILAYPNPKVVGTPLKTFRTIDMNNDKSSGNATFTDGEVAYFRIVDFKQGGFKIMSLLSSTIVKSINIKELSYRALYIIGVIFIAFVTTKAVRFTRRYISMKKEREMLLGEMSELRDKDEKRSNFFTLAAHDIQMTQNGLISVARDMLDRAALTTDTREAMYSIVTTGKRVAMGLASLIVYSEPGYVKKDIVIEPLELRPIVDFVLRMQLPMIANKNVKVTNSVPESFPEVMAENEAIEHLLINLISNAIKYTYEGSVIVTADIDRNRALVSVVDDGRGIEPEKLEEINAALKSPSNNIDPDLGLGLNIAKRIVRQHGGNIWIESPINAGTTVNFTLRINGNNI